MTSQREQERASWIGVNAYGVFVALLVILLSLRHLFAWVGGPLTHSGYIGYGLAGVGLLVGYARTRIDVEVYASVTLFASNVAVLLGNISESGFDAWSALVTAVLGITVSARIAAVVRGGVFVLPKWER